MKQSDSSGAGPSPGALARSPTLGLCYTCENSLEGKPDASVRRGPGDRPTMTIGVKLSFSGLRQ